MEGSAWFEAAPCRAGRWSGAGRQVPLRGRHDRNTASTVPPLDRRSGRVKHLLLVWSFVSKPGRVSNPVPRGGPVIFGVATSSRTISGPDTRPNPSAAAAIRACRPALLSRPPCPVPRRFRRRHRRGGGPEDAPGAVVEAEAAALPVDRDGAAPATCAMAWARSLTSSRIVAGAGTSEPVITPLDRGGRLARAHDHHAVARHGGHARSTRTAPPSTRTG